MISHHRHPSRSPGARLYAYLPEALYEALREVALPSLLSPSCSKMLPINEAPEVHKIAPNLLDATRA